MSRRTLLYTEMVSASAVVLGDTGQLLALDPFEYPLALQLGGSDPRRLADAVSLCAGRGFSEYNLNAGCPSDKVREGSFGAVLMKDPERTYECLSAMREAAGNTEVTLKCRIGVDGQDPPRALPSFIETVSRSGIRRIVIHARKAWLQGLSPKENRSIPPLDHRLVIRMQAEFPSLRICINGGINSLEEAESFLGQGVYGVMIGRAAYRNPAGVLMDADSRIFGDGRKPPTRRQVLAGMMLYLRRHCETGGRITAVTRHMLGLYSGLPGARLWRRELSDPGLNTAGGLARLERVFAAFGGGDAESGAMRLPAGSLTRGLSAAPAAAAAPDSEAA